MPSQDNEAGARTNGRLSAEDIAFIVANREKLSAKEIADRLGRRVVTIEQYMGLEAEPGNKTGFRWSNLKQSLTSEEREMFREEYERFKGETEDEFLPAEESQLISVVEIGILIARNMKKQRQVEDDILRIEGYKNAIEKKTYGKGISPSPEQFEELKEFKRDIKELKIDLEKLIGQYNEFLAARSKILTTLKMTRDQRVKELESGKETFVSLLRLLNNKQHSATAGRQMELYRLAAEKEKSRLSQMMVFPDGKEDQPLYNSDTVGLFDADRNHQQERALDPSETSEPVEQDDSDGAGGP